MICMMMKLFTSKSSLPMIIFYCVCLYLLLIPSSSFYFSSFRQNHRTSLSSNINREFYLYGKKSNSFQRCQFQESIQTSTSFPTKRLSIGTHLKMAEECNSDERKKKAALASFFEEDETDSSVLGLQTKFYSMLGFTAIALVLSIVFNGNSLAIAADPLTLSSYFDPAGFQV